MTAVGKRDVFQTADPAQAREFISHTYGARLASTGGGGMKVAVAHTDTGAFAVSNITLGADLDFAVGTSPLVTVTTVTQGWLEAKQGKTSDRFAPGDVLAANSPDIGYLCRVHDMTNQNIVLPLTLFHAVTGPRAKRSAPLRFLSLHPVNAAAQSQWQRAGRYTSELLATPPAISSPLLISAAAQLLAATALAVFPNSAVAGPTVEDRHDAHPDTLRRATAFIDEYAHTDITAADIAAAAHVTVRAVQLAFRHHLGMTPLDYLRRVRLEHAHGELTAADPTRQTVTAIAYRWGFPSPSRFAAAYRQAYGVVPSQTLRS